MDHFDTFNQFFDEKLFDEIISGEPRYLKPQPGDWDELVKLKSLLERLRVDDAAREIISDFIGKFSNYDAAMTRLVEASTDYLNQPNPHYEDLLEAAVEDVAAFYGENPCNPG